MPIRREVRISYPDRQQLVSGLCANVSVEGMFVESPLPPPLGAWVRFELDLAALHGAVAGVGEVVWRRDDGITAPGFGMRFVELDARHRQLIFRLVDRFVQRGGEPFDLDGG